MDSAQEAEICLSLQRGPDTPRDEEDHYREHDGDGEPRPQFTTIQQHFKTKGCEK